ncbi:MAG TPA: dienelactone hydrolase family protein [Chloroflexota bacterium]|nr:dienelactone hydrolase family protein [Chloroflexota bacterium]
MEQNVPFGWFQREVEIPAQAVMLPGILGMPKGAIGVVLFAHGSGSGRFSPRNQFVARVLQEAGFATLLLDLLTVNESEDRRYVFDIALLARRLIAATAWTHQQAELKALPIGYFGASTGAGAALVAAAHEGKQISAVVSRGGRPDLADGDLANVTAPTLLIVGGWDQPVIALNEQAYNEIHAPKKLVIVPRATHLFEEPGKLEEVAELATDWFTTYLTRKQVA